MTVEEAIVYALEGSAILFLGSGFSKGAKNTDNKEFPVGDDLCKRLIADGRIDTAEDSESDIRDLGYISDRYLEKNTKRDLLKFLRNQFKCRQYTNDQKEIGCMPWKRIYTTNYDDVLEMLSMEAGIDRESITPEKKSSDVLNYKNAIVHMNGFIGSVTEENLETTFKLLGSSYRKRTIPESDWAISLQHDILNAKCFICIGYSLDYDLELQQIFATDEELKEKCLFVTWNPSKRTRKNMEEYGEIYEQGTQGFADAVRKVGASYSTMVRTYALNCLKEVTSCDDNVINSITDADVTDLFFNGKVKMELLFSADCFKYIVGRECAKDAANDIAGECRAVILHSDIGNGKSILARLLETMLLKQNKGRVYYLDKINSFFRDDLDYICAERGIKFIFIENYNRIIDSPYARIFSMYNRDDIRYIFTVRSYLNDNLYGRFLEQFKIPENQISMYDINVMTNGECLNMRALLNKYSLWGSNSNLSPTQKVKYISKNCNGEMKNIMLDILKSDYMKEKIRKVVEQLFKNNDLKQITLLIFVCEVIALELTLSDITLLLGKQTITTEFTRNDKIREFLDFKRNVVSLKSPLVAYHIIQEYDFNEEVEKILRKVLSVLNRHSNISKYENMLRMLISYSNLKMIFSPKDSQVNIRIIGIYELGKELSYHERNPFFWLQYAIARMEIKDYKTADIYLQNASAYSDMKYKKELWQIEIHRARLLLEQTMQEDNKAQAYMNFEQAHNLLYNNETPDMHYPLRQVALYNKYYIKFYNGFTSDEKRMFLWYCIEMQNKIQKYLTSSRISERRNREKSRQVEAIDKMLSRIRSDIVKKEEKGE